VVTTARVEARLWPEAGLQLQRRAAGQQAAAQDRAERRRVVVHSAGSRDRLGDGVGLLRGKAALAQREGRHLAGGVDGGLTRDSSVQVDGDETGAIARQPRDGSRDDVGERDDVVGGDDLAAFEPQPTRDELARLRTHDQFDAERVERRRDGIAGGGTEKAESLFLGSHDPDGGGGAVLSQLVRRQQRELVERQRPTRRRRQRERDASGVASQNVGNERPQPSGRVRARGERQRADKRLDAARAVAAARTS
jgi:hypothetical protein